MGTRSIIGFRKSDNSISAVDCHWDGYPDHMLPALTKAIETLGKARFKAHVRAAQFELGLRCVDADGRFETYHAFDEARDGQLPYPPEHLADHHIYRSLPDAYKEVCWIYIMDRDGNLEVHTTFARDGLGE